MNHKTTTLAILSLIALASTPSAVHATDSTSPTPSLRPRQQLHQEIKEERQEAKEIRQNFFSQIKQKAIDNIYQRLRNGLDHRYTSLVKSKSRIQDRLNTKKSNSNLTDNQKNILTQAQDKLNSTSTSESSFQAHLSALDSLLSQIKTSAKPSDLIPQLKDIVNQAKVDLTAIHQALTDAIRLIVQVPGASKND